MSDDWIKSYFIGGAAGGGKSDWLNYGKHSYFFNEELWRNKMREFPKTVTLKHMGNTGFISNYSDTQARQRVMELTAAAERPDSPFTGPMAVYTLVGIIERKEPKDLTDFQNGTYYWTDREGTRSRIQDLSTEHLREILSMPNFKNSRLTDRMKKAIQYELDRRDYCTNL